MATPLELVIAAAVAPVLNAPLAPLAGAVNVTVAPLTGLPKLSSTVAWSAANAVFTVALCGVPLLMLAAGRALLVRLKLAEVPTPATLAVTV